MKQHGLVWRRSAISAAIGVFLATGVAYAQQTSGSISGRAAKGDVISVSNASINVNRQATVGDDGSWQLTQLPAGTYQVTVTRLDGTKQVINVAVTSGLGATATFPSAATQTITVTGSAIRTIDVGSVAAAFTLSKDEIDRTPVAQNITAVTLLSPGTVQGDGRIGGTAARSGNLASISGASVAENAYYINGFNVTNITKGIAFNEVPFQAIGEVAVLNSGYGAQYGRSLGGVVSVNTKRGTNEWKGGATASYAPRDLRGSAVYSDQSVTTGKWNLVQRPGWVERTEVNIYGGGPLIKDTLYVFGLVESAKNIEPTFGEETQARFDASGPKYLVKLDWQLNRNNLIEVTSFSDKSTEEVDNYRQVAPYGTARGTPIGLDKYTTGGDNHIAKWTGNLTDDFTLSALYGVGKYNRKNQIAASACPAVYDGRRPGQPLLYLGCWSESAGIAIDDPNASDKRTASRLDAEWILGKHTLRAGLDNETYDTIDGSVYTGGFYDRLFTLAPGGTIGGTGYTNTTGVAQDYVRQRVFRNGGTFKTKNSAWYVEDDFQVSKDVLVNLGIRNESFENLNDSGKTFIKVKNTWSPRGGVSWDVNGNGQSKLYANAGRYYIPVYANTNVRLSGAETFYTDYFLFDGTYSTDGKSVPGKGAQLGNRVVTSNGEPKDPRTVVDPNIKPMFQDELIIGYQQALGNGWAAGIKVTSRALQKGMDDVCEGTLAEQWALTAGYTADQAATIGGTIANCFLYNPGGPLTANVDLDGTGELTPVKIPASALRLPKSNRTYKSIELTAERQWDKKWSMSASYVMAWSRGNTEGYVKSDNGQDDAGITQDFDHPGLAEGSKGNLPNDRRHAFKLQGSYAVTDEWRLGLALVIQSGRPKNCFGNYPEVTDPQTFPAGPNADDDSDLYGAASFYCNGVLNPRGTLGRTQWTRDLSLQALYQPQSIKGLSLGVNILNVFNERGIRGIDEAGELDSVGSLNPTYQRPLAGSIQRPRSVRLTANYEF